MPANKVAVLIDTKPGEALFYKPDELLAAASVLAEVVRRCESCCICIWECRMVPLRTVVHSCVKISYSCRQW